MPIGRNSAYTKSQTVSRVSNAYQGQECGVVRTDRHALNFCMWILDGQVVQEEHAMEGLHEELYLRQISQTSCNYMERTYKHVDCDQQRNCNII